MFQLSSSFFRRPRATAFSLVEVTISLGIVSFALVGILGALPVAMDNERASLEQTRATLIASVFFSNLRSQPFTNARYLDSQVSPTGGPSSEPLDLTTLNNDSSPLVCFASIGEGLLGADGDTRVMHFYSTAKGDNCFQIAIRCDPWPSAPTPQDATKTSHVASATGLVSRVDLAIGSIGGAMESTKSPPQLKNPFHFCSIITNRGQ